jgi:hypothetical protein
MDALKLREAFYVRLMASLCWRRGFYRAPRNRRFVADTLQAGQWKEA